MNISKILTALLAVQYSLNSTFEIKNGPNKENFLYPCLKSYFDKSYEINFFKILILWYKSWYHFKNVDCSTSILIFPKLELFTDKRPEKRNRFISIIKIKFRQKSSNYFFNISFTDNSKTTDSSTSILTKDMMSCLQNLNILISARWPFRKCKLQYF